MFINNKLTVLAASTACIATGTLIIFDSLTSQAVAGIINVGTANNAANWSITGSGAVAAPAFQTNNIISLTTNGLRTGTFVPGGSLAQFNGFWFADLTFFLPADATNVALNLTGAGADDRVVFQLNGVDIGNAGILSPGVGQMTFSSGSPQVSYSFTGLGSGLITSGFNVGGLNTLRSIVNNTNFGIFGTTITLTNDGDGTGLFLEGTVTFDQPGTTPEPTSTVSILALGTLSLAFNLKRKMKPSK